MKLKVVLNEFVDRYLHNIDLFDNCFHYLDKFHCLDVLLLHDNFPHDFLFNSIRMKMKMNILLLFYLDNLDWLFRDLDFDSHEKDVVHLQPMDFQHKNCCCIFLHLEEEEEEEEKCKIILK